MAGTLTETRFAWPTKGEQQNKQKEPEDEDDDQSNEEMLLLAERDLPTNSVSFMDGESLF